MSNPTVQTPTLHDPFEIFERVIPTINDKAGEVNLTNLLSDTFAQLPNPKQMAKRLVEELILPQEEGKPRAYVGSRPSAADPEGSYLKKRGQLMLRTLSGIGVMPMLSAGPDDWTNGQCMHTLLLSQLQQHAGKVTTQAGSLLSFPVNAILTDGTHMWYVGRVHLRATSATRVGYTSNGHRLRTNAALELPAPGSLKPLVCGPMCHDHLVNVAVNANERPELVSVS